MLATYLFLAVLLPSKSKKMNLFDFMVPGTLPLKSNTMRNKDKPGPSRDFQRLLNMSPSAGFEVCSDTQLASLRPIALELFSALSSSAASELVFSQAKLIMKPARSRLSKNRLADNHLK
jgi:hypothetical protein